LNRKTTLLAAAFAAAGLTAPAMAQQSQNQDQQDWNSQQQPGQPFYNEAEGARAGSLMYGTNISEDYEPATNWPQDRNQNRYGQQQRNQNQQGQQRFQSQQQNQGQQQVSGRIQSYRTVSLDGEDQDHVVARIKTQDGRTKVLDLGKVGDLAIQRTRLDKGMRISASGQSGTINDRSVIVVDNVDIEGQRPRTSYRRQQDQQRQQDRQYSWQQDQQRQQDQQYSWQQDQQRQQDRQYSWQQDQQRQQDQQYGQQDQQRQQDRQYSWQQDQQRQQDRQYSWQQDQQYGQQDQQYGQQYAMPRQQQNQQQSRWQQDQQRQQQGLTRVRGAQGFDAQNQLAYIQGRITDMTDVSLQGVPEQHRLVKVQLGQNQTVVADLGTREQFDQLNLQTGDTVFVYGNPIRIDDRPVLLASHVAELKGDIIKIDQQHRATRQDLRTRGSEQSGQY
jgi:hypothetical protein